MIRAPRIDRRESIACYWHSTRVYSLLILTRSLFSHTILPSSAPPHRQPSPVARSPCVRGQVFVIVPLHSRCPRSLFLFAGPPAGLLGTGLASLSPTAPTSQTNYVAHHHQDAHTDEREDIASLGRPDVAACGMLIDQHINNSKFKYCYKMLASTATAVTVCTPYRCFQFEVLPKKHALLCFSDAVYSPYG